VFSHHSARMRDFKLENGEVGQARLYMVEMKLRVYGLEIVDGHSSLQRPDRVSAAYGGHLRMANRDRRRTITAQPARAVCGVRRIGNVDSDILEFEIGAGGYRDWPSEIEIDVLQFYVPIDMEYSMVPVRAFTADDRAVFKRGKRALTQHWQGQQDN
jgi:hypothetical protein